MNGWIAVQSHIISNETVAFDECVHWDRSTFPTRKEAVDHGFQSFGSDDFNVGEIRDGALVWWGWMNTPLLEDLAYTADKLGLTVTS